MDVQAKTGSLSAETPWVAEEYFAKSSTRRQPSFPSSTATSWCSRMRHHSNPRRRGPVLNVEDHHHHHHPTANEVLARFGVTEVGYDSRSKAPLILIHSAALERVRPNRPSTSSLRLDPIPSKNLLDFCNSCRPPSSLSKWNENDTTTEGEFLTMTELAKTNEDLFSHRQSCLENDFDRLEPCYDWYLSREQELNTVLETRSEHAAMGLGSPRFRYPPGNFGGFLRRPGTAPEMKVQVQKNVALLK